MLAAEHHRRAQLEHGAAGPLRTCQDRVTLRQLVHEAPRPFARELPLRTQHFESEQQSRSAHLPEAGVTMGFTKTHLILGEGDFVLVQSAGTFGDGEVTFYDLMRAAGGKVVEHWDVIEPLTPAGGWRHRNGKF